MGKSLTPDFQPPKPTRRSVRRAEKKVVIRHQLLLGPTLEYRERKRIAREQKLRRIQEQTERKGRDVKEIKKESVVMNRDLDVKRTIDKGGFDDDDDMPISKIIVPRRKVSPVTPAMVLETPVRHDGPKALIGEKHMMKKSGKSTFSKNQGKHLKNKAPVDKASEQVSSSPPTVPLNDSPNQQESSIVGITKRGKQVPGESLVQHDARRESTNKPRSKTDSASVKSEKTLVKTQSTEKVQAQRRRLKEIDPTKRKRNPKSIESNSKRSKQTVSKKRTVPAGTHRKIGQTSRRTASVSPCPDTEHQVIPIDSPSTENVQLELMVRNRLALLQRRKVAMEALVTASDLVSISASLAVVTELYRHEAYQPVAASLVRDARHAAHILTVQSLVERFTRPLAFGGLAYSDRKAQIIAEHLSVVLGAALGTSNITPTLLVRSGLSAADSVDVLPFIHAISDEVEIKVLAYMRFLSTVTGDDSRIDLVSSRQLLS